MRLLYWGISVLVLGFAYYCTFRYFPNHTWNDISQGSFPSFAFVLSFSLISTHFSRFTGLQQYLPSVAWFFIALATEPVLGSYAHQDIVASLLGCFIAVMLIRYVGCSESGNNSFRYSQSMVAVLGVGLLAGSYVPLYETPIYMSYSELRSSVRSEEPREFNDMTSIYLYEDRIFVNEKNKGLHVVDNSNPSAPTIEAFLNIPGNTSVSIRNGFLYADSFVDLVVIDIRDKDNVYEVSRQIDVFPYDPYQTIPDENVVFSEVDDSKGVVIGYE